MRSRRKASTEKGKIHFDSGVLRRISEEMLSELSPKRRPERRAETASRLRELLSACEPWGRLTALEFDL